MHPQFLNLLCCPRTGSTLTLEAITEGPNGMIKSGRLLTPEGKAYPIIDFIPHFVEAEHYSNTFGFEWNRWPRVQFESENIGKPMAGWTTRMWERIVMVDEKVVKDKILVEFGCGPGRFLDVIRRKGGKAVGIDLSHAVVAARRNFQDDPDVLVVRGDLGSPPFRPDVFDGGYTIGVLHHTPAPAAGLNALVRTIKRQGWVACCVYPRGELYDYRSVTRARKIHHRLSQKFGYRPALAYANFSSHVLVPLFRIGKKFPLVRQFLQWMEREWLVIVDLRDVRWRVLDTFDAITPYYASTHTGVEVKAWMEQAGCAEIRASDWCATAFSGIKN